MSITTYLLVRKALSKLDEVLARLAKLEEKMSKLDDNITALKSKVDGLTTVVGSAVTLINGISGMIQVAVQAALAQGATPAQLQDLTDLSARLDAQSSSLAAAVASNTTPPTP